MTTDTTVAELMALADVFATTFEAKDRAALEQAIRRAVDFEQVAWLRRSRITQKVTGFFPVDDDPELMSECLEPLYARSTKP